MNAEGNRLTLCRAVVPLASLFLSHAELGAQTETLVHGRQEKQDGKLPDAAPLAADQLGCLEADLLGGADLSA